ncbi:phosphatase family protein [Paracoccidioides lutzii Pb01]|uniref:Phosphatase family protein n=1 Tax=Paracoccidioides lutzii (strain ATCC MYA-826 / Pb01) TaxID=502779 RepID=C1HAA0_PARBA|nr:phosphatase family protein [Paracoccidioides lutzii Pb01]EEH37273.1 phosphatase family protein [Paracoccidioides lutzii Pb01]
MSLREAESNPTDVSGTFLDSLDSNGDDIPPSSDFQSLSRAVKARKAEFTRQRQIRVKIGTWNVAALPGTEADIGCWFVKPSGLNRENEIYARSGNAKKAHRRNGEADSWVDQELVGQGSAQWNTASLELPAPGAPGDDVDIYVLGLQEIVDVSSPSESLKPYVDPAPSNRWKEAVQNALPLGYKLISSQQLVGLLLLVYASPSVAPMISSVSSVGVGTGVMGYMGNKGGVATRIVVGGTTRLVFVNCHLAAGADKGSLDRRNWDASQIISRAKFNPLEEGDDILEDDGNMIGYEDFGFWFGDLNYRLEDIPGDDVRRLLHLHTENKFHAMKSPSIHDEKASLSSPTQNSNGNSIGSGRSSIDTGSNNLSPEPHISLEDNSIFDPHLDPASLVTTLASLLPHDQLHRQQRSGKALYDGWREGHISFLPTYKYDIGTTGTFDSSEKRRGPSWCDRILFRTRHDYLEYKRKLKEAEEAKKRDEEMKSLGLEQEAENDSVLFYYDPEVDGANDYDENVDTTGATTASGNDQTESKDIIRLNFYTSHQDIVSSDHKPLAAEFTLTFDAVVPELKAKVHQEVVRELDKAENEARPGVTVVVENHPDDSDDNQASHIANDPNVVNFGQVRYDVPVSRSLTVANTSGVPATFSFHHRPPDKDEENGLTSPSWLRLQVDGSPDGDAQNPKTRPKYTLQPGETTNVQLVLCIYDIAFVRELNNGEAKIEDIIVLRVTNGRDYFIPVHGSWLTSCFGFSLEDLTRMPEDGARHLNPGVQSLRSTETHTKQDTRLSAPRELFRLTETIAELTERAVAEWDMVDDNSQSDLPPWSAEKLGWPFEAETWTLADSRERYHLLSRVRDALDTNTPFSSVFPPELPSRHRVELLSETLLSFLKSIRGGIITAPLWHELERHVINLEKSKSSPLTTEQLQTQILEVISSSPAHSVSFTFVTFMLNRVVNEIAPLSPTNSLSTPLSPTTSKPFFSRRTHSISETSLSDPLQSIPTSPSTITNSAPASSMVNAMSRTFSIRLGKPGNQSTSGSYPDVPTAIAAKATAASARRQAVSKIFARIFAQTIFSNDIERPEKERERRVWEDRRKAILEPFLV